MLRLFKRKKDRSLSMMGTVWLKWTDSFKGKLRKWAGYLTDRTNRYSVRTLKIGLVTVCVLAGAGYVNIAINAFSKPAALRPIDKVSIPKHVILDEGEKAGPVQQVNPVSGHNIRRFNYYMDSLQKTVEGKRIYDSILRVRPGLLDSIRKVEMMLGIE